MFASGNLLCRDTPGARYGWEFCIITGGALESIMKRPGSGGKRRPKKGTPGRRIALIQSTEEDGIANHVLAISLLNSPFPC